MNRLYIISYDLNNPSYDYTDLFRRIESLGKALHILTTVWLLKTTQDVNQISMALREQMNDNDILFVSELHESNYQGWINKTYWKWIKEK